MNQQPQQNTTLNDIATQLAELRGTVKNVHNIVLIGLGVVAIAIGAMVYVNQSFQQQMTAQFERMEMQFGQQFERMNAQFGSMDRKLDQLGDIKTEIAVLNNKFDTLEGRVVSLEQTLLGIGEQLRAIVPSEKKIE